VPPKPEIPKFSGWEDSNNLVELRRQMKDRFKIGQLKFSKSITRDEKVKLYNVMGRYLSGVYGKNTGLGELVQVNKVITSIEFVDSRFLRTKGLGNSVGGVYNRDWQNKGSIRIAAKDLMRQVRRTDDLDLIAKRLSRWPHDELSVGPDIIGDVAHNVSFKGPGILRHEIGHHFHYVARGGAKKLANDMKRLYERKGAKWVKRNVSLYSGTNWHEFYAESFAAYTSPLYKSGMLPKEVEVLFDRVFKK
jgi:hypothetical protein